MRDDELPAAKIEVPKAQFLPLEPIGSSTAPIIFADSVLTGGFRDGIGNITLEAVRHMVSADGTVLADRVVVAQLRLSHAGLRMLGDAVAQALLQAAPPASNASN